jgi:hypothetical protein
VLVEIHPDQPDRSPVAFRLTNPAEEWETEKEKYQGGHIRASEILLLGELAE